MPPYAISFVIAVLKLSSKWAMLDGREWAIGYLSTLKDPEFTQALRLHVAMKYNVPSWIQPAFERLVRGEWLRGQFVSIPGTEIVPEVVDLIIRTRDLLEQERRRLFVVPPQALHSKACTSNNTCSDSWHTAWTTQIGRLLVHPHRAFQLQCADGPKVVSKMKVPGMHRECLALTVSEERIALGFRFEENVIEAALTSHHLI
jgi:hypothetical protein